MTNDDALNFVAKSTKSPFFRFCLSRKWTLASLCAVGAGFLFFGYFRYTRRDRQKKQTSINGSIGKPDPARLSTRRRPIYGEQNSRISRRSETQNNDVNLAMEIESLSEVVRYLEKAKSTFSKDYQGHESLEHLLNRVKDLYAEFHEILNKKCNEINLAQISLTPSLDEVAKWQQTVRSGTLSVLSDDSFLSALEDVTILSNEHNRQWLIKGTRQLIADLMRQAGKDPVDFFTAFDKMIEFLSSVDKTDEITAELKYRRVAAFGFWDVVLDFIILDAFEDLSHPPSALVAVSKNRFLGDSFKQATLSTVIWSILRAKRQRLQVSDGYIAHFYDISEQVSPYFTWGLLGTNENLRELCHYFKDQVCTFVVDIFDVQVVRYISVQDLADDIWSNLRTRLEMVQTRLSTELLPADH